VRPRRFAHPRSGASPHIAGPTFDQYPRCGSLRCATIARFARAEPLEAVVSLADYDRRRSARRPVAIAIFCHEPHASCTLTPRIAMLTRAATSSEPPFRGVLQTLAHTPGPGSCSRWRQDGAASQHDDRRGSINSAERSCVAVSAFSNAPNRDAFQAVGVDTTACDLTNRANWRRARCPTVFFLAGVKFGTTSAPDLLQQMNVDMPRLVAARFARSRIVAFSSGCVIRLSGLRRSGHRAKPLQAVVRYAVCACPRSGITEASRRRRTPVTLIRLNYSVEFRYGCS